MLTLDTTLKVNQDLIDAPNLCDRFSDLDLTRIGNWVVDGYKVDKHSRGPWEKKMEEAMKVAMQVVKEKTFPWPRASNVAFPLVTIGALQFHSRAYPAIMNSQKLVKFKLPPQVSDPQVRLQARRVAHHMNYQLLEQDASWEEQHDRMMLVTAIVGCSFKKSYYSGAKRHNVSNLVMAENLVMDYFATSVDGCSRKTEVIPMLRNDIYERVRRGMFRDVLEETWYQSPAQVVPETNRDSHTGQVPPQPDEATPFKLLEQHCWLDFDHDGYAEPYIVTVEENSQKVLRIVARFESMDDVETDKWGNIITIRASEYYTKYGLIPAPDGSIYDIGFGILLGPLNSSVSSLINQLIDAGTMATTAGGFLGRGAKLRSGSYSFSPLEWKRVDATVDDLRKSIFPLPVREPSNVLFQLLSLLIDYSQRVSGATDMMSGINPGQNTPAETARSMITQGSKIFSAIYKRIWRSMKEEFRKLYILNARHLSNSGLMATKEDYLGDPNMIVPAAAPYVITEEQRIARATAVRQAAQTVSGYNKEEAEKDYLEALGLEDADVARLYPGEKVTGPLPNPKAQIEQSKIQVQMQKLKMEREEFLLQIMEQRRLNMAKIRELEARSIKEVAEAKGVQAGHAIAAFEAQVGALKAHDEALRSRIELMMKGIENEQSQQQGGQRAGVPGMEGAPSNAGAQQVPPAADGGA